jgi:chromosome segregation ATPase
MADDSEVQILEARLEELMAERDTAVHTLERHQAGASEEMRLLIEEQDRFVSRLLANHESELGRLRLELDEARITASRLEQKMERHRLTTTRLEEELGKARFALDRIREQRETSRAAAAVADARAAEAERIAERLRGDLALAKSMLEDAMEGTGEEALDAPVPPRESIRRTRRRSTPASQRSETPRGIALADLVPDSRSRR